MYYKHLSLRNITTSEQCIAAIDSIEADSSNYLGNWNRGGSDIRLNSGATRTLESLNKKLQALWVPFYSYHKARDSHNPSKYHYFRVSEDGAIEYNQGTSTTKFYDDWTEIDDLNEFAYGNYFATATYDKDNAS